MHRSTCAIALTAVLCLAAPPGPAAAQGSTPEPRTTRDPAPAAPRAPAADVETQTDGDGLSSPAIVLVGTVLGVAFLIGFRHTGRWMHRRLQERDGAAS